MVYLVSFIRSHTTCMKNLGAYSKGFITNVPADLSNEEYLFYKERLFKYPMEGIYIYSFEKGKMLYADGWESVCGVPDNEISMLGIVNMTSPEFGPFVNEVNDKALYFLHQRKDYLKEYSFTIEIKIRHRNGTDVPLVARVGVFDVFPDGHLKSIIGRFQVDYGLRFSKIMRFSAYGPEKDVFENDLNESLFYPYRISDKELEALRLLSLGHAYKEIAEILQISSSAVEKRIRPMFDRFGVKNNTSLVAFGFENNLLP